MSMAVRNGAGKLEVAGLVGLKYAPEAWCPTMLQAQREGANCWGLTRLALARMDITLPDTPEEAAATQRATLWRTAKGRPRAGDLWLIEYRNPETKELGQHFAVVIDGYRALHTTSGVGSRVQLLAALQRVYTVKERMRHVSVED